MPDDNNDGLVRPLVLEQTLTVDEAIELLQKFKASGKDFAGVARVLTDAERPDWVRSMLLVESI